MNEVFSVIKKIMYKQSAQINFLSRKIREFLFFMAKRYTLLSVIVLFICGTLFFFVTEYVFRYSNWDHWNWKKRAVKKTISFFLILILIKLILLGVLK